MKEVVVATEVVVKIENFSAEIPKNRNGVVQNIFPGVENSNKIQIQITGMTIACFCAQEVPLMKGETPPDK
jgi:hypothetical protein